MGSNTVHSLEARSNVQQRQDRKTKQPETITAHDLMSMRRVSYN